MNEDQVQKQIEQMVKFIRQEAVEKAREIHVKAEEEFNIEKLRMVEAEKARIRSEYERKEKDIEVTKRIGQSNHVRAARLSILAERQAQLVGLQEDAKKRLARLAQSDKYSSLLESLIVEGLIRLEGTAVSVRGVTGQANLVKNVLTGAVNKYKAWAEKEKGAAFVKEIDVTFVAEDAIKNSCGGVMLATAGNKIVLDNTLEARLELAMEARLPETRKVLFG
ncbi:hypothetical protein KFE25_000879 [Diacronema lutheri]|uniref:V-type proton ATPase subunit E n=1 Tax=Diacronema lutheri TaxID=2081491 RepID=A0A8J5XMA2_DIALT|nr:hypothetical protein KFE25_000879 [Diacronema lutheri]